MEELEAVILAGGKGTRLRSVVSDRPKPMAEVAGKPFLEWLVLELRSQGIHQIILSTGYLGEVVETYFGRGDRWGVTIRYSREESALGTGGAARQALQMIEGDRFLLLNGDSFCRVDFPDFLQKHQQRGAKASLYVVPTEDCRRYGTVVLGDRGDILAFEEKSEKKGSGLVSAGVYLLEKQAVTTLPPGQKISIETEFFPHLIGQGLYGVIGNGPFLDIGTPESYATAETFLRSQKAF